MLISLIVAMAENRVIGRGNQMPWHLPADLRHFKGVTLGKPVIMGRKTFESIGRPLPGRRNVVVSRNAEWSADGVECAGSLDAALALVHDAAEVMVIGGGQIKVIANANQIRIGKFIVKKRIGESAIAIVGCPSFV
jgi:dihydrofolate reductase